MDEQESKPYKPLSHVQDEEIPDDTITVIIKSGGRTFAKGVNLEDTQEETAKLVEVMMRAVLDTVDAKGLKAGGGKYNPEEK